MTDLLGLCFWGSYAVLLLGVWAPWPARRRSRVTLAGILGMLGAGLALYVGGTP